MSKTCEVIGCSRTDIYGHGYCRMHYKRFWRYGDPTYYPSRGNSKWKGEKCFIDGCKNEVRCMGLCNRHYSLKRRGRLYNPTKRHSVERYSKTHPLYSVWKNMNNRCRNPKLKCYKNYGGRGIKVCDRWQGVNGFKNFIKDMGMKPSEERYPSGLPIYTLDRIDPDGNYCPENCRWANDWVQANNKQDRNMQLRGVHFVKTRGTWRANITIRGETITKNFKTVAEAQAQRRKWEAEYKIDI